MCRQGSAISNPTFCHLDWDRRSGRESDTRKVAVECREPSRVGGQEPEANVPIRANQDHAARSDTGADRIDTGVGKDLNAVGPVPASRCRRRGNGLGRWGALEQLTHRVAGDAVRPTRTDHGAGVDRLDAAVPVHKLG